MQIVSQEAHRASRREILRLTSRTFALSMRVLPRAMRAPTELAYLLARAGDTWADRGALSPAMRCERLASLRSALGGGALPLWEPIGLTDTDAVSRAETELLRSVPRLLAEVRALPDEDREDVVRVVDRLALTMIEELRTLGAGTLDEPACLPDREALDRYTEGIAGCVGVFWTRLAARHAIPMSRARQHALEVEGRRFGRGLQLVNVLRDMTADRHRGRVYLPLDEMRRCGVEAADLGSERAHRALAGVRRAWIARSRRGLLAGLVYASALPTRCLALRFASALPAAIGLRTLALLEECDVATVAKIDRATLRATLARVAMLSLLPRGPLALARWPRRG